VDLIEQSLTTVVFCLVIFGVVWVFRTGLELLFPKLVAEGTKLNKVWREFILPLVPIVFGGLAGGLFSSYPYPELFTSTVSHVFFGMFGGLVSGLVYRLTKQNLLKDASGEYKDGPYIR
jgi:hypothetical protein